MQAYFLAVEPGRRFCLFHPAHGRPPLGRVLYVHPFAEEMNKSRRMAALHARALAKAGFSVLQIDLLGCGDSSGTAADARWQDWVRDLVAAHRWLGERAAGPSWLWGLRAGALLAAQAAAQIDETCNFLFWQPANSGKLLVQQFLRLKAANELIGGAAKGVVAQLRQQLERGEPVNVAGYQLGPQLLHGFEAATLAPPASTHPPGRLEWIELSNQADPALLPASVTALERWRSAGFTVNSQLAAGPAFWQTTEIEEAPALLAASLRALRADRRIDSKDDDAG